MQANRLRMVVVIMRQAMWGAIDGETTLTTLNKLVKVLPDPARVYISGVEVIVVDYAHWKRLVLQRQSSEKEANDV